MLVDVTFLDLGHIASGNTFKDSSMTSLRQRKWIIPTSQCSYHRNNLQKRRIMSRDSRQKWLG